MMRSKNIFPWLFLFTFSIAFVLIGFYLIKGQVEQDRLWPQIGLALIVAGIAAVTLNIAGGVVLALRTSGEIEDSKGAIQGTIEELRSAISIYKGSQEIGLTNLYSERAKAMDRIKSLLRAWEPPYCPGHEDSVDPNAREHRKPEAIYLIGISLRDFFDIGREPSNLSPDETMFRTIEALLTRAKDHRWELTDPILRVLVTNPLGYQAMLRMYREEQVDTLERPGDSRVSVPPEQCVADRRTHIEQNFDPAVFQRANLYIEVSRTFRIIETLKQKGLPIDIRGYVASPSCFVVLIPGKALFVEQYHYATPRDRVSGGQAPVLEFSPEAAIYSQIKAHADFIWAMSGGQDIESLLKALNDIQSSSKIWSKQWYCADSWATGTCQGWPRKSSPSPTVVSPSSTVDQRPIVPVPQRSRESEGVTPLASKDPKEEKQSE